MKTRLIGHPSEILPPLPSPSSPTLRARYGIAVDHNYFQMAVAELVVDRRWPLSPRRVATAWWSGKEVEVKVYDLAFKDIATGWAAKIEATHEPWDWEGKWVGGGGP